MDIIWQNFTQSIGFPTNQAFPLRFSPMLAQTFPVSASDPSDWGRFVQGITYNLGLILPGLLGAIAMLLIGWLIAVLVSAAVRGLLHRTNLDNRISAWVTGQPGQPTTQVEQWVAAIVFWVIMILAIVAALNALNLTTVSQPLNNFLNQIFVFLPKLGAAVILIGVAWVLATLTKAIVTRTARSFQLDENLSQQAEGTAENQFLLSDTLGNTLYWFIFLFFLPLILGVLDLQGPLQPVQNLLDQVLGALPNILKAIIIGAIGWLIARVVRNIVTNLLVATGTDRLGAQFGFSPTTGGQSLSWLIGTIVYVLILIPTATAALDALKIPAISGPATSMLNQIFNALPQIFTAVLILVLAYVIGRFVADLVSNILTGIGFNNIFYWLGLQPTPYSPLPTPPVVPETTEQESGQQTVIQDAGVTPYPTRSPSEIVGIVVLVGIMLFATVAATNVLNFPGLTTIVTGLLIIFGQILAGLVVFAVGLYLANLAFNLIRSSGNGQARILAQTARIAIIALVSAMALQQMGIAPNIVNLAFGLLLGAIAVAIALAFGLGGRETAADLLREWLNNFRQKRY
jgi:hypothetical protein